MKTSGIKPEGRFHHAMHFYPKGNYVVVAGGRRLTNYTHHVLHDSEFLEPAHSMSILRVDSLEWFEVKFKNAPGFPELYNFSSSLDGDSLLIFGGIKKNYRFSNSLLTI